MCIENDIINDFVKDQISKCGKEAILKRYLTMNATLNQIAKEFNDSKKASILTDVVDVLNIITEYIKNK